MRAAVSRICWIARLKLRAALSDTLSAERAALTGASPEAVEKQAAEKTRLLGAIEKLEDERRTLAESRASRGCPARAFRSARASRPPWRNAGEP